MSDMTTDLVSIPRDVARDALADIMSEISENDWAAGWMSGTEDGVFARLVGHERGKNWTWTDARRERLLVIARAIGEWPNPDGEGWVALSVMEAKWGTLQDVTP